MNPCQHLSHDQPEHIARRRRNHVTLRVGELKREQSGRTKVNDRSLAGIDQYVINLCDDFNHGMSLRLGVWESASRLRSFAVLRNSGRRTDEVDR